MLFLEVVQSLANQLTDPTATRSFMDAVEFRQRRFRTNRSNVCILDPYDLISTHLLLRSTNTGAIVAYVRITSSSECLAHELDYPMEAIAQRDALYRQAYDRFKSLAHEALHMNLLCLDPDYRAELEGIKVVDLMIWLGFQESGLPRNALSFTATPNAKYHQDPWLKKIGPWVADLPDFTHPVIPETHRVIFIPELSEFYWKSQTGAYSSLYRSLKDRAVAYNNRSTGVHGVSAARAA